MSTRIRMLLTGLAAILFGGAVLLAYSGLAIEGPFLLQGDHRFGHVVTFGTFPFWLFLPMLAGLALLFVAWAVRDRSRLGTWGALMLLLLWGLQTTGQAVISFRNVMPVYREQPTFWVSEAFFAAKAWGLALLAIALFAVVAAEWLWPLAGREQPQPTG